MHKVLGVQYTCRVINACFQIHVLTCFCKPQWTYTYTHVYIIYDHICIWQILHVYGFGCPQRQCIHSHMCIKRCRYRYLHFSYLFLPLRARNRRAPWPKIEKSPSKVRITQAQWNPQKHSPRHAQVSSGRVIPLDYCLNSQHRHHCGPSRCHSYPQHRPYHCGDHHVMVQLHRWIRS